MLGQDDGGMVEGVLTLHTGYSTRGVVGGIEEDIYELLTMIICSNILLEHCNY